MEDTVTPRAWSGETLGRFMRSFGPISSVFDILTFLFLYFVLCPALCGGSTYTQLTDPTLRLHYVALFQTAGFGVHVDTGADFASAAHKESLLFAKQGIQPGPVCHAGRNHRLYFFNGHSFCGGAGADPAAAPVFWLLMLMVFALPICQRRCQAHISKTVSGN